MNQKHKELRNGEREQRERERKENGPLNDAQYFGSGQSHVRNDKTGTTVSSARMTGSEVEVG